MVFYQNKNTFTIKFESEFNPLLHTGLWIALLGIDETPPHIALIYDNGYYSLSVKKTDVGTPVENILKAIAKNSKPCLFVKINTTNLLTGKENTETPIFANEVAANIFQSYPPLSTSEKGNDNAPLTCFNPVRDFFCRLFSTNYGKATFVFDLLALAYKDGIIDGVKSVNFPKQKEITLPKYTHREIREKINSKTIPADNCYENKQ